MQSKELGSKVKIALIQLKQGDGSRWTQLKLAEAIDVNKNVLNQFILGKGGLQMDKITSIAKVLDCSFRVNSEGIDTLINPEGENKY